MSSSPSFVDITCQRRPARIEYQWIAPERAHEPLVVFLHEGLGSIGMWKDFPSHLCEATGFRGLVFSRPGYGLSTPRLVPEQRGVDYLHIQAHEVLPALLDALDVAEPPWLFGHSDGGSIALLYAARYPQCVSGLIVLAPHIFVEDITIAGLEQARATYTASDLPQKLGRYHEDADSVFWSWNRIWLDPSFRRWNIESELSRICCPVLAVQGVDDEYATLQQIRGIAEQTPHTSLLELPECGHSPHRDQPDKVIAATGRYIRANDQRCQPASTTPQAGARP